MSNTLMTKDQREKFLAGLHVGVLAIPDGPRGPLSAPIWYLYEPGAELWVVTAANTRKGKLLRVGGRVSLVAQNESPPYQYVSIEGPIVSIEATTDREFILGAHRYLGEQGGEEFLAENRENFKQPHLTVRIRPERWLTVDYTPKP